MEYTKGWHQEWYDSKASRIYDANGVLVLTLNIDHPNFFTNVHLIAASPDMYEALKLTRNNLQTLSDAALHYKKTFSANLEILNQALAKAEGTWTH